MTEQENALIIFAEECGEIATELLSLQKQIIKAMRFGIDEKRDVPTSNRERIEAEWQDVLGSMKHLANRGILIKANKKAITNKLIKIEKYEQYSKELGVIK